MHNSIYRHKHVQCTGKHIITRDLLLQSLRKCPLGDHGLFSCATDMNISAFCVHAACQDAIAVVGVCVCCVLPSWDSSSSRTSIFRNLCLQSYIAPGLNSTDSSDSVFLLWSGSLEFSRKRSILRFILQRLTDTFHSEHRQIHFDKI